MRTMDGYRETVRRRARGTKGVGDRIGINRQDPSNVSDYEIAKDTIAQ